METRHYILKPAFAKSKGIPTSVTAAALVQTEKAAYLFGTNQKVDSWVPKSCIEEVYDSDKEIQVPEDHPMLNGKKKTETPRRAVKVQFKESGKEGIKITFPFNQDDLAKVKSLPGRRFHKQASPPFWTCPLSIEAVESLQEWEFELDEGLQEFLRTSKLHADELPGKIEVPGLKGELRQFQRKGIEFLEQRNGRALIGDEMGLGKTIQTLGYLQLHPEKRPAIIVCPASLKLNWLKEIEGWMPNPNVQVLEGKDPSKPIVGDILIINYDILDDWVSVLKRIQPQVVIKDECHFIKNNNTKRTKAAKKLSKGVPHVIALSGTPIVNRPIEGFNALRIVDDTVVPSFWQYVQRYCDAKHNGFGWDFTGASNTEELHEKLVNTVMIRRKKAEVIADLPDKIYSSIPFEINNQKEYRRAQNDFIKYLTKTKGKDAADKASNAEVLTKIEGLKQIAVKGKIKQVKDWIQNFIESDGKLVVFATHKDIINELVNEFSDKAVKVDGSVSGSDREKAVEKFQNDESVRLFIGNIKAAGVGITLTAASNVAFVELPWSPGDCTQAEDRVHRIGQRGSVNIFYLLAANTIEEDIAALIDKKRQTLDQVLDGKGTDEGSLLTELLKGYED